MALPESTGTDDCFSMSTGPEPRVKKGRKMPEIHSATLPESIPQGKTFLLWKFSLMQSVDILHACLF